jgi:hypothetical protein
MKILPLSRLVLGLAFALALGACGPADLLPAGKVTVQWETASEVNTAGFNLYRADSQAGPYVKVNTALIPASGNQLTGSSYKYEDAAVQPGRVYYYELEDVETTGRTTRQAPIQVAVSGALDPLAIAASLILGAALVGTAGYVWLRLRKQPAQVKMEHETT